MMMKYKETDNTTSVQTVCCSLSVVSLLPNLSLYRIISLVLTPPPVFLPFLRDLAEGVVGGEEPSPIRLSVLIRWYNLSQTAS